MDPDEALRRLKDAIEKGRELFDDSNNDWPSAEEAPAVVKALDAFERAIMHFDGLDFWLRAGGALPYAWRTKKGGRNG